MAEGSGSSRQCVGHYLVQTGDGALAGLWSGEGGADVVFTADVRGESQWFYLA